MSMCGEIEGFHASQVCGLAFLLRKAAQEKSGVCQFGALAFTALANYLMNHEM
jgi:hypothetical protein